jgi:sugar phosphate isomerase/epimerase
MKSYTDRLLDLVERGKGNEEKYQRLCAEADERRESKKEPFVERAVEAIQKLIPEAEKHGVRLGVENREKLEEIPFDSDLQFLFKRLDHPSVIYWHDVGHAQIKENLGFIGHAMHLESLQDQLGGLHIHDVVPPGKDHRAPGTGSVDFAALKPFIKPDAVKVFELSPRLSADEVRQGVEHVRTLWTSEHVAGG